VTVEATACGVATLQGSDVARQWFQRLSRFWKARTGKTLKERRLDLSADSSTWVHNKGIAFGPKAKFVSLQAGCFQVWAFTTVKGQEITVTQNYSPPSKKEASTKLSRGEVQSKDGYVTASDSDEKE
jgi:hypothetical protein